MCKAQLGRRMPNNRLIRMEIRGRKYYLLSPVGTIGERVAILPKLFARRTRFLRLRFGLVEFAYRKLIKINDALIDVRKYLVM